MLDSEAFHLCFALSAYFVTVRIKLNTLNLIIQTLLFYITGSPACFGSCRDIIAATILREMRQFKK